MGEEVIHQIFESQGVWAALFILLLVYQLKENREARAEAKGREAYLTGFITEMCRNYENLSEQYIRLSEDMGYIRLQVSKKWAEEE